MYPRITPRTLGRLAADGERRMKRFRDVRNRLMREYAGRFYTKEPMQRAVAPVNLMHHAIATIVPNLVYATPRCRVTTEYMAYRPYADVLELAVNHLVREIDLKMELRKAITDSLFAFGVIKTGLASSGQTVDLMGELVDPGQPYASRVDPDDYFIDPYARDRNEALIEGDRVRVSKQWALESGLYNEDGIKACESRYDAVRKDDEASGMTRIDSDAIEWIDCREIWVPSEQRIDTIPWRADGPTDIVLRSAEYEGPEGGPYAMLGYHYAGDNPLPIPPASIWYDLHKQAERVGRRIARQAERGKSILAYVPDATEDAEEIEDARDGDTIKVAYPEGIKELEFGNPSDTAYQYMEWSRSYFAEMAMNVDLLSGARTDEPTATQAEIAQANTSVRLADMQSQVYGFTGDVMRQLAFFLHTDPLIELPLVKREKGVDRQVVYTPEMREGDFLDYHLKVVPYSMARQDPNLRVRRLMEFAGNVIPAFANAAMMLGPSFKLESALNLIGREMGIDELDEVVDSQLLEQVLERTRALIEQGIPVDRKAIETLMNPANNANAMLRPNGNGNGNGQRQPNQPNPGQQMRGGMTPQTERHQQQQETAGELQGTYTA